MQQASLWKLYSRFFSLFSHPGVGLVWQWNESSLPPVRHRHVTGPTERLFEIARCVTSGHVVCRVWNVRVIILWGLSASGHYVGLSQSCLIRGYCNRRNFRTRKKFVLWRSWTFVRYKFLYSEGSFTYTCICASFSYATNFRTFSQKYEIYEIKLHSKISAITVVE